MSYLFLSCTEKYIDKICRHPEAKKGGNTKVNQQIKIKGVTTK
ncbi:hypothetical protein J631_3717 [Acinetobacter baumannii 1271651]|nr:hypothetical protein J630_3861 [Acinetobacter baumannii 1178044]EXH20283.1 hypothetical protein J631_3717 [Acinetobacter baumannii 1271651]EXH36697.1 hypothetical protein J642_3669 [Acinetobacter baumannii 1264936]EXI45819.1 hypothetical protein J640_3610 [Acinetobacter baumannii 73736]